MDVGRLCLDCVTGITQPIDGLQPNQYRLILEFLYSLFIRPHGEDISQEHNSKAPRKGNPDIIANRLARQ